MTDRVSKAKLTRRPAADTLSLLYLTIRKTSRKDAAGKTSASLQHITGDLVESKMLHFGQQLVSAYAIVQRNFFYRDNSHRVHVNGRVYCCTCATSERTK